MTRFSCKLALAGLYLAFTIAPFHAIGLGVGLIAVAFAGAIALCSFDRQTAIEGDATNPGVLIMASIVALLGPVTILYLLPDLLYKLEFISRPPASDLVMGLALVFMSLTLFAWVWAPFLAYRLVDFIFDRFAKSPTKPA